MNALAIIGTTVISGLLGGAIGAYVGEKQETGDINFGEAILYCAGVGVIAGGFGGAVLGSVVFA